MTCKEFRRLNATDKAMMEMTVAEQAACNTHYCTCRKCRKFIKRSTVDPGDTRTNSERFVQGILRHLKFLEDPEYKP